MHSQTAMLDWTSASVSLGAVPTYDSRHPTRTQYPGDVSTCRCYVDLGTSRHLQVALSSNQGSALYGILCLRLEFKRNGWSMNVGFKQIVLWLPSTELNRNAGAPVKSVTNPR